MRVLITSAGGKLLPLLFIFLKKDKQLGITSIVGVDKKNIRNKKNLNKFYKINCKHPLQYFKQVFNICIKEKIDLIIPYSDLEAKILSKFKKKFLKKKIKVFVNDFNVLKRIDNKYLTYKILKKNKIQVPKFKLVKNTRQLFKALKEFKYPEEGAVIKPVSSSGGRGVIVLNGSKHKAEKWIFKGKREKVYIRKINKFSKKIFNNGPLMVMELLKSPAYDIDNFNFKNLHLSLVRKRINPAGIPYKGNIILCNNYLANYCASISKVLKLEYLTDIDLFTNNENKPVLLEVNPRPSGSAVVSYLAKIPLFSFCIAKIMEKKYFLNKTFKKKIK